MCIVSELTMQVPVEGWGCLDTVEGRLDPSSNLNGINNVVQQLH